MWWDWKPSNLKIKFRSLLGLLQHELQSNHLNSLCIVLQAPQHHLWGPPPAFLAHSLSFPLSQSCVFSCAPAPRWWWSCPCICTSQDLRRTGRYTQVGLGLWDLDFQRSLPAGSQAPKMLIRKVWWWLRQTQVLWLLVVPAYVSVLWLSKLPDWTGTSSHQLLLKI